MQHPRIQNGVHSRLAGPKTITLSVQLQGGALAAAVPLNSWTSTLFPSWESAASPGGRPIQATSAALHAPWLTNVKHQKAQKS